jgi:uncharacterized membrane protein
MNFNKFLIFFIIIFISYNISAFNVENINTKIIIRENGTLQISDTILLTNVEPLEKITLPMVSVYDLIIDSNFKDFNYSNSFNSLTINIPDCCILDNSVYLDIIYLTDVYSFKKEAVWSISYLPIFGDVTNNFNLVFPKNTKLIDLSVNFKNVSIIDNQFVVFLTDVSNFDTNYSINYKLLNNSNTKKSLFNFIYILIIILIVSFMVCYLLKKNKSFVVIKKNKNLLLGLNENEQKIINLLLSENGLSQKKITLKLFLPKGTISRNIKKLEQKGYIEIKKYGVTNKVFLGKVFSKK